MLESLYKYRFELFLVSQIAILFGSLVMPVNLFELLSPIFFYLNILAGSLFIGSKMKRNLMLIVLILAVIGGVFTLTEVYPSKTLNYIKFGLLFLFYLVVTYKIISRIWNAALVDKNVILGVISGFISLGLVGFCLCLSIEIMHPNSFSGIELVNDVGNTLTERLLYYSYITLMTIGYGDILPTTLLAQKATIVIGLIGQFYLVIVTGIIVGKFVNQKQAK